MTADNFSEALKPPSGDDSPSPSGPSAQSYSQTPAHDLLNPYLLAVNTFKNGQEFSAQPSAYERRKATETVDEDGQIGPTMTVKFTTSRN